jgi:protein-disulfide isomerase
VIERKSAARVDQDVAFGNENGVSGTPTVFINGERTQIVGVEQLRTLIGEIGR